MSNIGRKDRQVWYDFHSKQKSEPLNAQTRIKFLFGAILEHLLIFLAKEAGHTVRAEQARVEVDGVVGHQDAIIDDVVVDAKSCSSYSFRKFQNGDLTDDPFGYEAQLAGYSEGNQGMDGAFLAIDKQVGNITLFPISGDRLKKVDVRKRIEHLKKVIESKEPPVRCYEDKPFGKQGNKELAIGCAYCPYKKECWADANDGKGLRTFFYSDRPVYMTVVKKEPRVPELFSEDSNNE